MLTFESPFYEIEDVIIFRDHASPSTFHYLAGPPRLTRSPNGDPNLLLLKYKHAIDAMTTGAAPTRDQLGGAFLLFGVDCGVAEATKNSIKSKLEEFAPEDAGPISLVPVLYTKGKVSVIALDQQKSAATADDAQNKETSKFIRGILGTATPSLMQDQRAIFSISLTPDAATLIEQAYESDLSPIGVMYELEFSGLRPALSVKAEVDMKRVYESMKLGLHLGVGSTPSGPSGPTTPPPAAAPVTSPATPPPSQPAPTPTPAPAPAPPPPVPGAGPKTPTPGAPAPAPTPGAAAPAPAPAPGVPARGTQQEPIKGTGVYFSADIGYTLEKLKQEQAIKIEIVREQEGASVDQMEHNAMEMLKETVLNTMFQPAMTTSPAEAASAAASTAASMMATSADTDKGKAGQRQTTTSVQIGFQLQFKKDEQLKTATFDYSVIAPETRTHAPNGFFSALLTNTEKAKHIQEINLDDPFFKILNVEVSSIADFASLDLQAMTVHMQYGGTVEQPQVPGDFVFFPTKNDPQRFMAQLDKNDYSYRYKIEYLFGQSENVPGQSPKAETPWQSTTSRALIVHPPDDVAMLHVYIEPGVVDWDVVQLIEARLVYDDPANDFHTERTYLVRSDSKRQEWIVRLTNPQLTDYSLQYRWHLKDLSQIEGKLEPRSDNHLFVADPFVDRLPVTVDPQVAASNISRVSVELVYEDSAHDFLVRKQVDIEAPAFKRTTVMIPLVDAKKREYSYTVSLVKTNGQTEFHQPKMTDQLSVIITEGGVYLDVDVVLIGDLSALQVDALQVDLLAEPLDGAAPVIESHLFLPGDAKKFTQKLLLRADRPQQFKYRTKVLVKGDEINNDWEVYQSKILLLQLQRLLQT